MSNESPQPTPQEIYDASYEYGLAQVMIGVPTKDIEKQLLQRGVHPEMAAAVVSDLRIEQSAMIVRAGKRNMLYGTLWLLGGCLATGLCFLSARSGGSGGQFAVFYGAMLYGLFRMFRGLLQATTGKK